MSTFSNDGSFMEQFLAMQKHAETGAEEEAAEMLDRCEDPSKQEVVETGNQGSESSASFSETGSSDAAQPSAPAEQLKASAADSQKKKSLLAAFSTKKTIKKDVGALTFSSIPCHQFHHSHTSSIMCISVTLTRISHRPSTLAERRRKSWRTW
jgi:hypothetical protein